MSCATHRLWVCGRGELYHPPHSPCTVRSVRMDAVQSHSNGAECASCAVAAIPFRFTFVPFPLWQRAMVKSSSHPSREQAQPNFVIQGCIYQNSTQFSTLLGFCLSFHFVNQLLITPHVAPRAKFLEVQFGNRSICIHKQLAQMMVNVLLPLTTEEHGSTALPSCSDTD